MHSRFTWQATLVFALTSCSLSDGAQTKVDAGVEELLPPIVVEDFGTSCAVLCAVPGGIEECPPGTPCPRTTPARADAVFESPEEHVYSGDSAGMCLIER